MYEKSYISALISDIELKYKKERDDRCEKNSLIYVRQAREYLNIERIFEYLAGYLNIGR